MNKEDMRKLMVPNTYRKALEISILKWMTLPKHWDTFMKLKPKQRELHREYPNIFNCPLCYHFYKKVGDHCNGCPLVNNDKGCGETRSPYYRATDAIDKGNRKEFMLARKAMLARIVRALRRLDDK